MCSCRHVCPGNSFAAGIRFVIVHAILCYRGHCAGHLLKLPPAPRTSRAPHQVLVKDTLFKGRQIAWGSRRFRAGEPRLIVRVVYTISLSVLFYLRPPVRLPLSTFHRRQRSIGRIKLSQLACACAHSFRATITYGQPVLLLPTQKRRISMDDV